MALINCKNCGQEISEYAQKCPKCLIELKKIAPDQILEKKIVPPPLITTQPISNIAPQANISVQESKKKKNKILLWGGLGVALIALIFVSKYFIDKANESNSNYNNSSSAPSENNDSYEDDEVDYSDSDDDSHHSSSQEDKEEKEKEDEEEMKKKMVKEDIDSYVTLSVNDYTQKLLGGIKNLKLTVENSSDYPMESVTVQVDYYKLNDELYTTKFFEFYDVGANSYKTQNAPETEWGAYVRYAIIEINAPALN